LTNFPTSPSTTIPYCVTLIIKKTTSTTTACYATNLTISGFTIVSYYYNGGSSTVSNNVAQINTVAGQIIQQFVIQIPTTSTVIVNTSVNVFY